MAINFNYYQAINQAIKIENIACEMLNVSNNQLQESIDSVSACWRGEASKQFINYCSSTQNDIRSEAGKLQALSKRIREVALIIKEAEEQAVLLQRQEAESAMDVGSEGSISGGGRG